MKKQLKITGIIIAICIITTFGVTYSILDSIKMNEINKLDDSILTDINQVMALASENFTGPGHSFEIEVVNLTDCNAVVTVYSFDEPKMCVGFTYNLTKTEEGWIITSRQLSIIC